MTALHEAGVAELARALQARRVSSAEVTQHLLTLAVKLLAGVTTNALGFLTGLGDDFGFLRSGTLLRLGDDCSRFLAGTGELGLVFA